MENQEGGKTSAAQTIGLERLSSYVPHGIALLSLLCISLAVLFNIGFFLVIDINLMSVLTISDYIQSGLAFLPETVGVLIVASSAWSLLIWVWHRRPGSSPRSFSARTQAVVEISISALCVLTTAVFGYLFSFRLLMNYSFLVLLLMFILFSVLHRSDIRIRPPLFSAIIIFVAAAYTSFAYGHDQALKAILKEPSANVYVEGSADKISVSILRITSNYFIYYDGTPKIIQLNKIQKIELRNNDYEKIQSLSCVDHGICFGM
jgi:hypothetical protein